MQIAAAATIRMIARSIYSTSKKSVDVSSANANVSYKLMDVAIFCAEICEQD